MAKSNPRIEWLEKENGFLRDQIKRLTADPHDMAVTGCGDSGCIVQDPKGMHTNGGCRCEPHKLRMAVIYWRERARFLAASLIFLRDGDPVAWWDADAPHLKKLMGLPDGI